MNNGKEKFGDSNPIFRIPKWPKGLYEVYSCSLNKRLGVWKMLINKDKLNKFEEKKLKEFTIDSDKSRHDDMECSQYHPTDRERPPYHTGTKDHYDKRPPSGRDHSTADKGCSRQISYASGEKHYRDSPPPDTQIYIWSPKTNHHSDDKRRVQRRFLAYYSDSS